MDQWLASSEREMPLILLFGLPEPCPIVLSTIRPDSERPLIFHRSSESVLSKPATPFDQLKRQVVEFIRRMEKDVDMRQPIKEAIHKGPILDLVEDYRNIVEDEKKKLSEAETNYEQRKISRMYEDDPLCVNGSDTLCSYEWFQYFVQILPLVPVHPTLEPWTCCAHGQS